MLFRLIVLLMGGLFLAIGLEAEPLVAEYVRADRRAALMIVGSLLLTFLIALVAFQRTIDQPMQRLLAAGVHHVHRVASKARQWSVALGHQVACLLGPIDDRVVQLGQSP